MNEILKERIELASKRFAHLHPMASAASVITLRREAFQEGAMYALANQWISVERALPELKERVLVAYYGITRISICIMKRIPHDSSNPNNPEWHWSLTNNKEDVIAWTPIPEFTEGGGNAE